MQLTSWKTTLAGTAAILTSVIGIVQHFNDGTPIDIPQHVTEIMLGVGCLFSKDHDVKGGTRAVKHDSMVDSDRGAGYGADT